MSRHVAPSWTEPPPRRRPHLLLRRLPLAGLAALLLGLALDAASIVHANWAAMRTNMPHAAHTPTLDLVGSASAAASAQVRAVASPLIHDPPWKPTTTVVVGIAFAALTIWIIALRGP